MLIVFLSMCYGALLVLTGCLVYVVQQVRQDVDRCKEDILGALERHNDFEARLDALDLEKMQ